MPSDIGIEHSLHIFQAHQTQLRQNLPDFVFVYLHCNVPPIRVTDLGRNVSDEKIY